MNAAFLTDLAATLANGDSPAVTSATYTFVAGDVGAWVYVKTGTNWTPGFYQIASVTGGAATLSAAIGQAVQLNATTGLWGANTVAGCATVATPTGGTFGVDYSQQDAAEVTATDYSSLGSATTLTSVTGGFTSVMVGNIFHQTTTGTGGFGVVGWYEIVSVTDANNLVLDRTPNSGTASVACTGFIGGAGRFNGLVDEFLEMLPASSIVYIKSGTYAISTNVSVASTTSTAVLPSWLYGYTSLRGDACVGTNRPTLTFAAFTAVFGQGQLLANVQITISTAGGFTPGTSAGIRDSKVTNTSSVANRAGITGSNQNIFVIGCEIVSQNGTGLLLTTRTQLEGNYIHDCANGASIGVVNQNVQDCIFEGNTTAAIDYTVATPAAMVRGCTFYGREAKVGIGVSISNAASTTVRLVSNIFYGLTTGVSVNTAAGTNLGISNDFFNCTTDVANYTKSSTDLAVDPTFTGASQLTGSTATTAASVLTQSGGDFSTVTDNIDYLHVVSGTGVTVGCYLITSHTATTVTTNNALGTSSAGDVVWWIGTGHNFQIGTNLKALGYPSFSGVAPETTSYPDTGAVQRQEAAGSGGVVFSPGFDGGMN